MSEFLTRDELIAMHHRLIEEFGGSHGLIDFEALESAVMRPQIGYYHDIIEEAGALMESLAMYHPFVDGNKRLAFFATDVFLRLNGFISNAIMTRYMTILSHCLNQMLFALRI